MKYDKDDITSYNSLLNYGKYLDQVSMATYQMDKKGDIKVQEFEAPEGVNLAKKEKKYSYALYSNENFDANIAHSILIDKKVELKAINSVIKKTKEGKYGGINIDFEGISPKDKTLFTLFIKKLSAEAHKNKMKMIVSVPAKTSDCKNCDWIGAYDYASLGKSVDYIQIMTYDEHGPWSDPGAIASYNWVSQTISYSVKKVSANKILMGLAAYSYDWNLSDKTKNTGLKGKDYFDKAYKWDDKSKSPYFTYKDKENNNHVVWYENAKSISYKTSLMKKYHLRGIAIWRLGQENENLWKSIQNSLK